jgi:hypothetical protein
MLSDLGYKYTAGPSGDVSDLVLRQTADAGMGFVLAETLQDIADMAYTHESSATASDVSAVISSLQNPDNQLDDALNIKSLVNAASFAWFSYGMMAMTNTTYYVNKFYWDYIIRYDMGVLAYRTWWGWSELIRVFGNWFTWSMILVWWALTFAPFAATHELFAFFTEIFMYVYLARIFIVLIMKVLAFFMDSYVDEYQYYPYSIMWGGDDSDTAIDYSLELSTFIGLFIAYPLMQHSIKNIKIFEETRDMSMEAMADFGDTTLPTPENEFDEDSIF